MSAAKWEFAELNEVEPVKGSDFARMCGPGMVQSLEENCSVLWCFVGPYHGASLKYLKIAGPDSNGGVVYYKHCRRNHDIIACRRVLPVLFNLKMSAAPGNKIIVTVSGALSGQHLLSAAFPSDATMEAVHHKTFDAASALWPDRISVNTPLKFVYNDTVVNLRKQIANVCPLIKKHFKQLALTKDAKNVKQAVLKFK